MPPYMYEQIADDLRAKIRSGEYQPGTLIPSRRALCKTHGVSEIVVAGAVRELKREGLLALRPGVGLVVVDQAPQS